MLKYNTLLQNGCISIWDVLASILNSGRVGSQLFVHKCYVIEFVSPDFCSKVSLCSGFSFTWIKCTVQRENCLNPPEQQVSSRHYSHSQTLSFHFFTSRSIWRTGIPNHKTCHKLCDIFYDNAFPSRVWLSGKYWAVAILQFKQTTHILPRVDYSKWRTVEGKQKHYRSVSYCLFNITVDICSFMQQARACRRLSGGSSFNTDCFAVDTRKWRWRMWRFLIILWLLAAAGVPDLDVQEECSSVAGQDPSAASNSFHLSANECLSAVFTQHVTPL